MNHAVLVISLLSAGLVADFSSACAAEKPSLENFSEAVNFELGDTELAPGDKITIESIRGTDSAIKVGQRYCVSGAYLLSSHDAADLAVFVTTTSNVASAIGSAQVMKVQMGAGKFSLVFEMAQPGYPHVSFYPAGGGSSFGGVYFGQGSGVLKNKGLGHRGASRDLRDANAGAQATGLESQNRMILEYLGAPVPPPANLGPAYTKEGLITAMNLAAQKAGISLQRLEIDDSEFPFLVGLVTEEGDYPKLLEEIKKMPAYEEQGGVSTKTCRAINITPYRVFPSESAQRIGRRMTVREGMLFDRLITRSR